MSEITAYSIGVALTLGSTGVVVLCLRAPLRRILVDLCGSEARADFWVAFSVVALVLVPLIFSMSRGAGPHQAESAFFEIALQLRLALIGLAAALAALGVFLCIFILSAPQR